MNVPDLPPCHLRIAHAGGLDCASPRVHGAITAATCGRCPWRELAPGVPASSRGLGDTLAKVTTALGVTPCGGCKERQAWLNALVPYPTAPPVDPIVIGLASIPERADVLPHVLATLLEQQLPPTELHVYLNRFAHVPRLPESGRTRLVVHRSQECGPLESRGKFFGFRAIETAAYCFTVDDDILYPADYTAVLLSRIEHYRRRAVVGVHAADVVEPIRSYRASRRLFRFGAALAADRPVHVLGSGTLAWHRDTLRLDDRDFALANNDDPQLAVALQQRQIPAVAIARPAHWLRQATTDRTGSIGAARARDDAAPTEILRQVSPWRHLLDNSFVIQG